MKNKKKNSLIINLAVLAFSVIFFLAVFEIVLRVVYGPHLSYDVDDDLYWKLKPDSYGVPQFGLPQVTINSDGFRGPDIEPSKCTIMVFGDSQAFGWGVKDNETFSEVLDGMMGSDVEIINAGVPAWGLFQQAILFNQTYRAYNPDSVVLLLSRFDLFRVPFNDSASKQAYLRKKSLLGKTIGHFHVLRFIALKVNTVFHTQFGHQQQHFLDSSSDVRPLWNDQKKHVEAIRGALAADNKTLILALYQPRNSSNALSFYSLVRPSFGEDIIIIDDIHAYFDSIPLSELRISETDNHPSALAHRIVAGRLHEEYKKEGFIINGKRCAKQEGEQTKFSENVYSDRNKKREGSLANSWNISIIMLNASTLRINASSSDMTNFNIGDDFSNAYRYLEIVGGVGEWKASSSSVSGTAANIEYLAHFPIGWSRENPYGFLSGSFGAVSADILFPRGDKVNATYHLDFTNLGMGVHNSGFGDSKTYALSGDELFETYFVFGPFTADCEFLEGGAHVKVLSGGGKTINTSVCKNIKALFSYYAAEFGKPEQMLPSYEIGLFPARSYSSLNSGFYYPWPYYEFIAHELFHKWEPSANCTQETLVREGLASYMQVHAQYKAGILTHKEREALFDQKQALVSSLPSEYFSLSGEGLINLRKRNASAYSAIIYSRGALVWELMKQDGVMPEDSFRGYLQTKNCTILPFLVSTYDRKLLEEIGT